MAIELYMSLQFQSGHFMMKNKIFFYTQFMIQNMNVTIVLCKITSRILYVYKYICIYLHVIEYLKLEMNM